MKIGEINGTFGEVMLPNYKRAQVTLRPNKLSDGTIEYIMTTENGTPVGWFMPAGQGFKGGINGQNVSIITGRNGSGVYTI